MYGARTGTILDEAVTAALARLTVAYNLQALDWAIHLKQLAQLHFVDCGWDVVHHQVSDNLRLRIGLRRLAGWGELLLWDLLWLHLLRLGKLLLLGNALCHFF